MINQRYIDEISKLFSTPEELQAYLEACQKPLKKSLTINTAKIDREDFLNIVTPLGRTLKHPDFLEKSPTYYVDREDLTFPLGKTFFHQAGFFYIQEIAASMPANILDWNSNPLILDMSASPGGKTCQLAIKLLDQDRQAPGLTISNDLNKSRLLSLQHNINRMWAYNTVITNLNGTSFGKNHEEIFDAVLLDAPCSWEGTGFKSDSALKFRRQEEINKIAGTQWQLLVSALKTVKIWGSIVYSTCTLNPYENEAQISKLLKEYAGCVELEPVEIHAHDGHSTIGEESFLTAAQAKMVKRFWPHHEKTWGFFVAKLKKTSKILTGSFAQKYGKTQKSEPVRHANQFEYHNQIQKQVRTYIEDNYGIILTHDEVFFVATNNQIYATTPRRNDIKEIIPCEKIGIPIFRYSRLWHKELRPTHHLGQLRGNRATQNFVVINDEQAQSYANGEDIAIKVDWTSEYGIIKRKDYGFSVGKKIDDTIKNKFIAN